MSPTTPDLNSTAPGPESDDYPQKTSVIRRSMRCLVLGTMGFCPILGIAIAIQAALLHHRLARETGEDWQPWRAPAAWLAQAIVFVPMAYLRGMPLWSLATAMCLVFIIGLAIYFAWAYHRAKPRWWNPARRTLWLGGFLAWSGVAIFAQVVLTILTNLYVTFRDYP